MTIKQWKQKKKEINIRKKYGYVVYFDKNTYYTDGLLFSKFHLPELEIKLPMMNPEVAFEIIDYYAHQLSENRLLLHDSLCIKDYIDLETYLKASITPRGQDSYRIIFPDFYNKFPWDENCEINYKMQWTAKDKLNNQIIVYNDEKEDNSIE